MHVSHSHRLDLFGQQIFAVENERKKRQTNKEKNTKLLYTRTIDG